MKPTGKCQASIAKLAAAFALACLAAGCATQLPPVQGPADMQAVSFRSGSGDTVSALWKESRPSAPTVILLHGSDGIWWYQDGSGQLKRYLNRYRTLFAQSGYNVLIIDSLRSRGIRDLNDNPGRRLLFPDDRAKDVWGAIGWLRSKNVQGKVALVGFSNGAATVLSALDASQSHPAIAAGVALYPRCAPYLGHEDRIAKAVYDYKASAPLLLLNGTLDRNTPIGPCQKLAAHLQAKGCNARLVPFEGVGHAFDQRLANPTEAMNKAREASYKEMSAFLKVAFTGN